MNKSQAFADNLRKWRAHRGLSLRQFGESVGLSHAHVLKIERGQTEPRLTDATRMAEALEVPLDALMTPGSFEEYAARIKEVEREWAKDR